MERVKVIDNGGAFRQKNTLLGRRVEQAAWEVCRGAHAFTRRFGVYGWSLLACLVVGGLAWVVARQQLAVEGRLDAQMVERLAPDFRYPTRAPAASGSDSIADYDGRARLQAFDHYLLPHDDIPTLLQDLLHLAEEDKVSIQHGEYRPQIDTAGGFLRYHMILPVKGDAPAIHHFMQAALRTQRTLALESVQFKRERIESPVIEARIHWVVLVRLPVQEAKAGLTTTARAASGVTE
jgi:hypothetical protein